MAQIAEDDRYLSAYIDLVHPGTKGSQEWTAFVGYMHAHAAEELGRVDFSVVQVSWNADKQLITAASEACQKRPGRQVLYLVADDGDYADMLREHRSRGVQVHVLGSGKCSERLVRAVEPGNYVHFDRPYVVVEAVEVLKEASGKALTKSELGNKIKAALDEDQIYPQDVGFSTRNPYGSLLGWLQLNGVITLEEGARGTVTVTVPGTRQ